MAPNTRTKVSSSALFVLIGVALGAYALDQISKAIVVANMTEGSVVQVLGGVLQLHFVRNPGAAFSLASGMTWIFSILAAAVVVFIIWFAGRIRSIAWALVFGLLLGGVLGNLTDRLLRPPGFGVGHVIDFIATPWLIPAIYNVADMCIVSSMVIFMILTIRGIGLDGKRLPQPATDAGSGATTGTEADADASVDADAEAPVEAPVDSEASAEAGTDLPADPQPRTES